MADMGRAERLAMLNNIMRWNIANAKMWREQGTEEGHNNCERMLGTARHLLAQIMELEKDETI